MVKIRKNRYLCQSKRTGMEENKIPKLLLRLDFMLKSVLFVAVFSVMFMIVYAPFSISGWFDIFNGQHLKLAVAFYIASIFALITSKIALAKVSNRITITRLSYVLWLLGEVLFISLLYVLFTIYLAYDGGFEHISRLFVRAFCCSAAILAIPNIILTLYAAYKSKEEVYDVMRYHSPQSAADNESSRLVSLCDSSGVAKLTIDIDSLYYIESQDNYVKIYYENNGTLQHYMLRCRTSVIEKILADTTMVRCHRSFIINTSKIKLLHSEKTNHIIILKHHNINPIPVSKTYYDRLMKTISHEPDIH